MAGDVDAVLHELGDGGRFQVVTYLLLSVPMVYVVISSTSFVFTSGDLNYRCRVPECDGNGTGFEAEWVEWALPPGHHECVRYEVKVNTSLPKEPGSCPASMFVNATVPCDEFIFEDDELTILREWNLTCKANKWKLSVAGTLIYSGALLSKPLAGFVSDRYGRKVLLLGGLALAALTGAVRGMASTYTMFQVCNLLEGVFGGGIYSAAFVMGLELLGPRRRVLGGAFMSSLNAAGEVLMGAIAWGFRSWRMIHMVVYAPSLLFVAYIWLLPESVRWLLAKGREEEATAILRRAARMNGVTLSEGHMAALHKVTEAEDDPAPHRGVLQQVLRSRVLMVRLLLCSFCWASVGFTFSGLTFNATSLAGNKYVNFMLAGFIELPGHVITYLGMAHVGRRLTLGASLAVSGAACFLFVAVPADMPWLSTGLYLLGKFTITTAYDVLYMFAAELFPTPMRHSLLSACSMLGGVGAVAAPQTPLLASYFEPLPLLLFGSTAVTSALLTFLLPETRGQRLPDTVEEAERLGSPRLPLQECRREAGLA